MSRFRKLCRYDTIDLNANVSEDSQIVFDILYKFKAESLKQNQSSSHLDVYCTAVHS